MRQRRWWNGIVARSAYVVIGAGIGVGVSLGSAYTGTGQWVVWASLAIALTAASGAVFGHGLACWPELVALGPIRVGRVVTYVMLLAAAGVAMLAASTALTTISANAEAPTVSRGPIGLILVTVAALGASPVAAGLAVIREQAGAGDPDADNGRRIESVLAWRRLLAGYLAALGGQVTLATLALGASPAEGGSASAGIVVVFGATSSLWMALAYAPSAGAVRVAARDLSSVLVPLPGTALADLPARLVERRQVEQALGLDRGLLADLQSGVIVIAPLLASAAALFLPG